MARSVRQALAVRTSMSGGLAPSSAGSARAICPTARTTASRVAAHTGTIFSLPRSALRRRPSRRRNTELGITLKPQGNAAQPWHPWHQSRLPVGDPADKLPTCVAHPDVRESRRAVDERGQWLIHGRALLRPRHRYRSQRRFCRLGADSAIGEPPTVSRDIDEPKSVSSRRFNEQRQRRAIDGSLLVL